MKRRKPKTTRELRRQNERQWRIASKVELKEAVEKDTWAYLRKMWRGSDDSHVRP